jgi:cytochrome c biogenesis protein CcdA
VTPEQAENRGLAWVVGAFVICPCHLPLTLWGVAVLLSGTAAGVLLREHVYAAGAAISVLWAAATWRGVRYFRAASACERN